MSKTQAERAKAYRQKKRDGNVTVERDAASRNVTEAERDESVTNEKVAGPFNDASNRAAARMAKPTFADLPPEAQAQLKQDMDATIRPLDIYSEQRWKNLQSRGHVWDQDKQRGVRLDGIIGVPVPGDPAYGPTGNQVCSCGKDTGHKLVAKCLACCTGVTV